MGANLGLESEKIYWPSKVQEFVQAAGIYIFSTYKIMTHCEESN